MEVSITLDALCQDIYDKRSGKASSILFQYLHHNLYLRLTQYKRSRFFSKTPVIDTEGPFRNFDHIRPYSKSFFLLLPKFYSTCRTSMRLLLKRNWRMASVGTNIYRHLLSMGPSVSMVTIIY